MTDRTILRSLLEIEQKNFARKLELIDGNLEWIPDGLCLSGLNLLKDISNKEDTDFNRQLAIMIVSLLWTHCAPCVRDNLRQIITPILSSMGFSPSNLMLDESLRETGIYSAMGSYLDKLRIAVNDLKNQVVVNEKTYILTAFQSDLWKAIDESKLLGISAPTSAGKSFLLYLKIIDLISKGSRRFVYVVPTLSLITQVTSDLSKLLREHALEHIEILNSYEKDIDQFIYVVTQERAISLFSEEGVESIDLLVVDEIQNIEKVSGEGDDRSKILYDVLIDVRNDIEVNKILLSGPRLKNIGRLGFDIFGETSSEKSTDSPPVFSITYSISKQNRKYFLNQYSIAFDTPLQILINNDHHIHGLGGVQYNENFNNYLNKTLLCLKDEVNVVFSPTSIQARRSANSYSRSLEVNRHEKLDSLASYLRETVHPQYELANFVESGVAYHTGKTPMHVRKSIESATSDKLIHTLFCTTTLMQGVNLPAKNVIVRNPNLFTRRRERNSELSAYEFANLRGRAGRLMTDFIGRTVVLDEEAFSSNCNTGEGTLFPEEHKEIQTGYNQTYDQHSEFIDNALASGDLTDDAPAKNLITYIRQILYRHGGDGISRLKDVGLYIDEGLLKGIAPKLKNLNVPREVVLSNRYWDPLDLDTLYSIYQDIQRPLPSNVFSSGLCYDLLNWMKVMHKNMAYYFQRYLRNVDDERYMYGIAKSAESWSREKSLSTILYDRFSNESSNIDDKIDAEIDKLGKHVGFGLPMLLKPLSDMSGKESSIISSIEQGIYSPFTKHFVDRGVPRETAIKISRFASENNMSSEPSKIERNHFRSQLNYWEIKQTEHIL